MPTWASWKYGEEYLPPSFHTLAGFTKDMDTISMVGIGANALSPGLLLAYGLALRDIHRAHFLLADPDEPAPQGVPGHIISSALSLNNVSTITDSLAVAM